MVSGKNTDSIVKYTHIILSYTHETSEIFFQSNIFEVDMEALGQERLLPFHAHHQSPLPYKFTNNIQHAKHLSSFQQSHHQKM